MYLPARNYYQIYRVDHKRNQEQMVAEVEKLYEAEKLVEKYLRNMTASEVKAEISYHRSTSSSRAPKIENSPSTSPRQKPDIPLFRVGRSTEWRLNELVSRKWLVPAKA